MPRARRTAPWLPGTSLCTSAASCSKPHQLPGLPPRGLPCPGRSAQDMRPRTLAVSRVTSPGSSQAWDHLATVPSCTRTQPTTHMFAATATPVSSSAPCPLPQVRRPCLPPSAPAHPSMGFFLRGSRNSFVLIQAENKGLDREINNDKGTSPPHGPRTAQPQPQPQPTREGLGQHGAS